MKLRKFRMPKWKRQMKLIKGSVFGGKKAKKVSKKKMVKKAAGKPKRKLT
jgi:hypothetical protein